MSYRIAGIDVHKKKLAVVVADLELGRETQFERRWYGSNPEQLRALAEWLIEQQVEEVVMESHRPILETSLGCAGAVLASGLSEAGDCRPQVRNPTSGASFVQSGAAGTQEGFHRLRTFDQAAGIRRADLELCAQC